MSYPALLAEDLRGSKALGRSFRLTRGRWWATFGAVLVMYLIVLVISGILGLLLGATLIASLDSEALAAVLTTIVNTLPSLITLPLFAAVLTMIYYDLRVRKEGFDLHLLAQGVGGDAPTPENVAASSGLGWSEPSSGGGFAPPAPQGDSRRRRPALPAAAFRAEIRWEALRRSAARTTGEPPADPAAAPGCRRGARRHGAAGRGSGAGRARRARRTPRPRARRRGRS